MNTSNLKMAGLFLCFFAIPVHATNKSVVVNQTNQKIAVAWTALGCLHNIFKHGQTCSGVLLEPGQSHKFQYHWGATSDHIHMGGYIEKGGRYFVTGSIIGFDPNFHLIQSIGGNCELSAPNGKVVYLKSMTIDQDKATINCEYEIKKPSNIDTFHVTNPQPAGEEEDMCYLW